MRIKHYLMFGIGFSCICSKQNDQKMDVEKLEIISRPIKLILLLPYLGALKYLHPYMGVLSMLILGHTSNK